MLKELDPIYQFIVDFNENIELRDTLWKMGFIKNKSFAQAHQASVLNFGLQEQNIFQTHISRFHTYQTLFQVFLLLSRHFFSVLDSLQGIYASRNDQGSNCQGLRTREVRNVLSKTGERNFVGTDNRFGALDIGEGRNVIEIVTGMHESYGKPTVLHPLLVL